MVTTALSLFFLGAPVSKVLDVPLFPQQQSKWCWAASTQMVTSYLGADISQCKQANARFGRDDCCTSPTPAACNKGGGQQFSKWFFDYDVANGALSFSSLKAQINANKPVYFAWSWDGGGGHVMVATGYYENGTTKLVYINDPWSPNVGDQRWISYAEYVEVDGDHTHQDDKYNIRDNKQCEVDFHKVPSGQWQDCYDYQTQRSRYLLNLSANRDSASSTSMQGSFREGGASQIVRSLRTSAEYQAYYDDYAADGWRPKQVTAVQTSGGTRFTAIFVPENDNFASFHRLTQAQAEQKIQTYYNAGWRMVDFSAYRENGETYFITTFVDEPGTWGAYYNMSIGGFDANNADLKADGYEVTRFQRYETDAGIRYLALWQPKTVNVHLAKNLDADGYQAHYENVSANGWRPWIITSLNNVYSTIFK